MPQNTWGKVLNIAKFFPVYHFVKANTRISPYEIRNELLIMILFAVAFLLLAHSIEKIPENECFELRVI